MLFSIMADYTRRVQILLTDEQFDFLNDLSQRRQRSVGDLMRTAFEEVYRPASSLRELQSLAQLKQHTYIEESVQEMLASLDRPRFS